jgi:hypothetical protein
MRSTTDQTTYRLIEIPLDSVDVFPWLQGWLAEGYAKDTTESLARGCHSAANRRSGRR